jgi:hypothetical protein
LYARPVPRRKPLVRRFERDRWAFPTVVVLAVAASVAVRTPDAVREALWGDEVGVARIATAPSHGAAMERIARRESTPPTYYLIARYTHRAGAEARAAGAPRQLSSFTAVRLLSIAFGALLAGFVVAYARRLLPLSGAALAGLLAATGFQLAEHGKEMRAYALLALLAVVFVFALEAAVDRPSPRRLVALGAVVALGSTTHYFFLWPLSLGVAWAWRSARDARARTRVTAAVTVSLLPLLLWLDDLLQQTRRVSQHFPSFGFRPIANLYSDLFASSAAWSRVGVVGRLAVVALVLAGAVVLARRREGRLCALLAVAPVPLTALVWALGLDVFTTRNLIVVAPFAGIAVAAGVSALPVRPLALAATALVAAAALWTFSIDRTLGRTPYDRVANGTVALGWTAADPLVLFGAWVERVPLGWYLPGHPRLVVGHPTAGACRQLYAVVESEAGRAWLDAHRDMLVASRPFRWNGYGWQGKRRTPDLVVAALRWSRRLAENAVRDGAFMLRATGHSPPKCWASGFEAREAD